MSSELQRARSRQMFIFFARLLWYGGLVGRLYYWQVSALFRPYQRANEEARQKSYRECAAWTYLRCSGTSPAQQMWCETTSI